jgi:hypothetical protein
VNCRAIGITLQELNGLRRRLKRIASLPDYLRPPVKTALLVAALFASLAAQSAPPSDLDALMERALAQRNENWKKLQQYVLDDREEVDVRTPTGAPLFGERRDYTWYIRDGYFVRSPVKANGVTIGERERREYEERWIKREKEREKRRAGNDGTEGQQPTAGGQDTPGEIGALLRQTIEPRFISAAYFLDFTFEPGNYFLAGRDTLEGRDVLRIEYYPTKLFSHNHDDKTKAGTPDDDSRRRRRRKDRDDEGNEIERKMDKVALVTLWVDPRSTQIVKYTFDNVGLDFLPGRWLVRIDEMRASMEMGQPFPDVWLPRRIEMRVALTFANGTYPLRYDLTFHDYRLANVTSKIKADRR